MVFQERTKKEQAQKDDAPNREVRRAQLLLKRLNEPPKDLLQRAALGLKLQKIPDNIRAEATKAVPPPPPPPPPLPGAGADVDRAVPPPLPLPDVSNIAEEFGVEPDRLKALMQTPEFEKMVADELAKGAGHGE